MSTRLTKLLMLSTVNGSNNVRRESKDDRMSNERERARRWLKRKDNRKGRRREMATTWQKTKSGKNLRKSKLKKISSIASLLDDSSSINKFFSGWNSFSVSPISPRSINHSFRLVISNSQMYIYNFISGRNVAVRRIRLTERFTQERHSLMDATSIYRIVRFMAVSINRFPAVCFFLYFKCEI